MTKKKKPKKSPKKPDYFKDLYGDTCDDRFAYIAGYTSGGAPYGSTWEEMGIDPSLPSEEKVTLLGSGDFQLVESDDFPFGNPEEEVDTLVIDVIPEKFSVCKVADYSEIDIDQPFVFTGRTDAEKSLVCPTRIVPKNTVHREDGWRAFRIVGELDFSLVGILADIANLLAANEIAIFAISTYNTDYVLTKEKVFRKAIKILDTAGYVIADK